MSKNNVNEEDQDKTVLEKKLIEKSKNVDDEKKTRVCIVDQNGQLKCCSLVNLRTIFYSSISGLVFGICMNKGTVFVAPTIRQQMLFQRFAMLKMFFAAAGTSMLSVALLTLVCNDRYSKIFKGYVEHNSRRGVLHYMIGGTLIGLGMVTCGSCPGTVFIQLGSGITNSLFTALGGLLGTFFYYTYVHQAVSQTKLPENSIVSKRVSDLFNIPPIIVHSGLGALLLGTSIGLEFVIPWTRDLSPRLLEYGTIDISKSKSLFLGMAAWPPSICGAGVGLLQLFFIVLLEKSLGVSSAFTVFAAQFCRIKSVAEAVPELKAFTYGVKNYTAAFFAIAAIGGSALSSTLSGTIPLGPENGTNILSSVLGGFLLLLGARFAGGCTSGQGISGMTHLLVGSFITTACMFGGGIIFGFSSYLSSGDWSFQNL